jgi:predicted RNase H-like HicB family nuclease
MRSNGLRSYAFPVEIERATDGRWAATCPTLPGCATWGLTMEEALGNIREAAEAYAKDVTAAGEPLPEERRLPDAPAVCVTL